MCRDLSLCLSVFRLNNSKSYGWILIKFCAGVEGGPKTQKSNFAGTTIQDSDPGFLNQDFILVAHRFCVESMMFATVVF